MWNRCFIECNSERRAAKNYRGTEVLLLRDGGRQMLVLVPRLVKNSTGVDGRIVFQRGAYRCCRQRPKQQPFRFHLAIPFCSCRPTATL